MENNNTQLTDQEKMFCDLLAHGEAPYAGNPARCYAEAFNDHSFAVKSRATKLMARPEIQEYLNSLEELPYEESRYMKIFLRENLKKIVEECSSGQFYDRKGTLLSPAAMRSVAVNASKALMDLYPVKEAQTTKVSIDGAGEGGITFNVIMPGTSNPETKEE